MEPSAEHEGIRLGWRELVPGGLGLWVPDDPDELLEGLDEEELRLAEDRTPYFAALWPAGEALAHHVLEASEAFEGRSVLDLGCGVGAAGLAALCRGASVTFLDWEPRSLGLVDLSARRQGLAPAALVVGDWRDPPRLPPVDLVLAADVLYEMRNVRPVSRFLAAHLAPRGEAWLADPRRREAEALPQAVAGAGLRLHPAVPLPYRPRGVRVDLWRVTRDPSP